TPLFVSSDEKFDDASVAQPLCGIAVGFFQKHSPLHPAFSDKKYRTPCTEYGICMQQQKAGITAALIPESVCPPASPVLPAVS
ncbi:hypothetical protein, partial [Ruminococcus callidus]|uniref:hypothetical protein n=1 Tax=Ruminococcus callidus TaxID=40519 RepID=UPI0023F4A5C4